MPSLEQELKWSLPPLLSKSVEDELFVALDIDRAKVQEGEELEGDIEKIPSLFGFKNSKSLLFSSRFAELYCWDLELLPRKPLEEVLESLRTSL